MTYCNYISTILSVYTILLGCKPLIYSLHCVFVFSQMAATQDSTQNENPDQNFDYMFKLLIIGNSSVGKTSFLFRYADDTFTSAFVSTVGIDFKVKTVYKNDKRIKLQIWVISFTHIDRKNHTNFKSSLTRHQCFMLGKALKGWIITYGAM